MDAHRTSRSRLIALAVGLLTAAIAAPARAAVPPVDFVGLNDWASPSAQTLQQFGGAGLKTWRIPLPWSLIESTKGTYNWGGYDALVQNGANSGVRMLFVVSTCPRWACSDTLQPPATSAAKDAQTAFVAAAVDRYGTSGSFWPSHVGVPYVPVTHWQIWNEVNEERNLKSGEPAEYLELLRRNAQTIRARDPQAKIVLSGITEKGDPKWLDEWLPAFYALDPNVKNDFDIMAIHGYAADPEGFYSILDQARRIMSKNGDGDKRLWVTEIGWGTEGPLHPFSPGTQLQNAYLKQAFDTAVACRERWKLDRVFWFGLNNGDPRANGLPDYWGFHNGLRFLNGSDKASMATFLQYLGGKELGRADTCDLPGGDVVNPNAPTAGAATKTSFYYNRLPVTLTFKSDEAGTSFICYFQNEPPVNCTDGFVTPSNLVEGIYKLTVRTLDPEGNAGPPQVFGFLLDLTAPETLVTTPQENRTTKSTFTFDWGATDDGGVGKDFECQIDTAEWKACVPPFTTPEGLPEGRHEVGIRAIDYAGNTEPNPARAAFFVDTTVPQTTMKSPGPFTAPISYNDLTFTFVAYVQNATFECRMDAGEYAACSSPKSYADIPDGTHLFEVRALDPVGNADETPANRAFTIDSTAGPTAPQALFLRSSLKQALKRKYVPIRVQIVQPDTTVKFTIRPWKKRKIIGKGTFPKLKPGPRELRPKLTKAGKKFLAKRKGRTRIAIRLESLYADGTTARSDRSAFLR